VLFVILSPNHARDTGSGWNRERAHLIDSLQWFRMEPKGSKRNPFGGGVSQFIRCEAPSSLHPGIERWFTLSLTGVTPTIFFADCSIRNGLASLQTAFIGTDIPSADVVLTPGPLVGNLRIDFGIFTRGLHGRFTLQIRPETIGSFQKY
jgi:hypothetical protein